MKDFTKRADGTVTILSDDNPMDVRTMTLTPADLRKLEALGWVSVDDALPEDFIEVLTNLGYVYYQDNGLWRDAAFHMTTDSSKITHWRPLPAPPGGET